MPFPFISKKDLYSFEKKKNQYPISNSKNVLKLVIFYSIVLIIQFRVFLLLKKKHNILFSDFENCTYAHTTSLEADKDNIPTQTVDKVQKHLKGQCRYFDQGVQR